MILINQYPIREEFTTHQLCINVSMIEVYKYGNCACRKIMNAFIYISIISCIVQHCNVFKKTLRRTSRFGQAEYNAKCSK